MRDSPIAAFSFLIAMTLIPLVLGYAVLWWLLHYTNTGLLVYKEQVTAATPAESDSRNAETVLQCTYFTGFQVLHREFSSEASMTDQDEAPAVSCPWRIEVSRSA